MNINEYKALKKMAAAQLGADDADSLGVFADRMEKQAKTLKWLSIAFFILSLPMMIIVIGIPVLLFAIGIYFLGYRKMVKKVEVFREYLRNDRELLASS